MYRIMQLCSLGLAVSALCSACAVSPPAAAAPAGMDPAAADWLIPKLCADAANQPVGVDPYGGCPTGTHLRALVPGDPLPYRRGDMAGQQIKDVYPRIAADGTPLVIAAFDWHDPNNGDTSRFKLWADGYDTYTAAEGWTSVVETRMGTGEYGTSFVAQGCKRNLGQVFFPLPPPDAQSPAGSTTRGSATSAWEEDDQAFPGDCPSRYVADQLYSWQFVHDFPYGGIGGVPVRALDSIITTVGLRTSKDPQVMKRWMSYGHLEVFYFTRLYGVTRWESWVPEQQFEHDGREPAAQEQARADGATSACGAGPGMSVSSFTRGDTGKPAKRITMVYQGMPFTMSDCRDWSSIQVQSTPLQPPAWPVSKLNLLHNFHFNGASVSAMQGWDTSRLQHGSIELSGTTDDTTKDTPSPLRGVNYLKLACGGGCPSDQLVQEIPVSPAAGSGRYTLGLIARTESGTGALELSLSQLDQHGKLLSTSTFLANPLSAEETGCDSAGKHCRSYSFDPVARTGSVVLASNFLSQTLPVSLDPQARTLRYAIVPKSNSDFDLVSAWLMVSP